MSLSSLDQKCAMQTAGDVLATLWRDAGMPDGATGRVGFGPKAPGFPSSFAIGRAAESAIAAAALAATELDALRHPGKAPQSVHVDAAHALAETTGYFTLNGERPSIWSPISGLYPCGAELGDPGHVRIHANFDHHRDGALQLLGLPVGAQTTQADVVQALKSWHALEFEQRATDAGLVVAALRTPEEWRAHPQALALQEQPLVQLTLLDADEPAPPLPWCETSPEQLPLAGLRVLDLTRILAGPVGARTLAAYGADVLMINSPHLPNIEAIADVSRGKRSALLDLAQPHGAAQLESLVRNAHVFLQGYRPGSLERLGFGVAEVAKMRPGIVYASLSAYGREGAWRDKRGFDSLVQTVTGMNRAEGDAFGDPSPRALPVQMLDYSAGFLLAFGTQVALHRQATVGGTWHVQVALARVAQWLWEMGRLAVADQGEPGDVEALVAPWLHTSSSGFGTLRAVSHAATLSRTPARWKCDSVPPGTHEPLWT
ncbi:CoA transferase [Diaphorobacter sp.]|uniref:CoA transferase n=1 Tax=Diaphorobacter sp. TaxID=1934310 RepID=UPI0028ABE0F0|nr:CoA transferase [Diaphorobacter sp.]